jgi:hypothetical protein
MCPLGAAPRDLETVTETRRRGKQSDLEVRYFVCGLPPADHDENVYAFGEFFFLDA